ncbi:MAG: DNA recombination protein RmuC [Deltaproteobacteria bacterium CG11_big_fil_rev_8_21_14_0_20_49_13]|nr:MAG: DNA recombination protein RmuC [Deltaproteobacteria bacterium CG11_big_fil_rev_8_21_14_0_20_49_13]
MSSTIVILVGFLSFILGGTACWLFLSAKNRTNDETIADLKGKLEASNNISTEIKKQTEQRDKTIEELRGSLESVQKAKAIAETRLEETSKHIEEQKKTLSQAEEKLTTTFKALSGESLKSNNQAFLQLAKQSLETVLNQAMGDMSQKEIAIKNIVKPLEDVLKKYESQVIELEKTRVGAYSTLESQIKMLMSSEQQLQKETNNLVTALRRPEVRGRWGEMTLKRVVELAGMTSYCDYVEQVSVDTDKGRLRPDMIVHLPSDREIVIDSKVSLDAYLDAIASQSEDAKESFLVKHSQQITKHMRELSEKNYWDQFPRAPEFVVMFIPGESFLASALEKDPAIIEKGMEDRVIIATPTTLIALLRAIAYGWRQEQITKHAQEIAVLGKEMYDRFQPFLEHVNKVGGSLNQSVVSFNKMIMSLERRVMVSVKKFKELGAAGDKELPEVQPIEQIPMKAQATEKLENEEEEK